MDGKTRLGELSTEEILFEVFTDTKQSMKLGLLLFQFSCILLHFRFFIQLFPWQCPIMRSCFFGTSLSGHFLNLNKLSKTKG